MSTAELREKVLSKIEQINEDYLLKDLLNLIEFEEEEGSFEIPETHIENHKRPR